MPMLSAQQIDTFHCLVAARTSRRWSSCERVWAISWSLFSNNWIYCCAIVLNSVQEIWFQVVGLDLYSITYAYCIYIIHSYIEPVHRIISTEYTYPHSPRYISIHSVLRNDVQDIPRVICSPLLRPNALSGTWILSLANFQIESCFAIY